MFPRVSLLQVDDIVMRNHILFHTIFGCVPRTLRKTLKEEFEHRYNIPASGVRLLQCEKWIAPNLNRIEARKVETIDMTHWDTTLLSKVLLKSSLLTEKVDLVGVYIVKKNALNLGELIISCSNSIPTHFAKSNSLVILGTKGRQLLFVTNAVKTTRSSCLNIRIKLPAYAVKELETCAPLHDVKHLRFHICTPKWHAVKTLRDLRNSFCHRNSPSITSEEFQETTKQVKLTLSQLSENHPLTDGNDDLCPLCYSISHCYYVY